MGHSSRPLDIVLYGASGFTGRFVAEHLAAADPGLRWGVAGRDKVKLEALCRELNRPDVEVLLADAGDEAQLERLVGATRLVLTTAGPFSLYGSGLLAACARAGVDYADITGDSVWVRQMIERHDAVAQASGARVLTSAGYDSIPAELGVMLLQKEAMRRWGEPLKHVRARIRTFNGGFSGGSFASAKARAAAVAADPAQQAALDDPFSLTPGFMGQPQPEAQDVRFDEHIKAWLAPFVMAQVNTKNIHRSNSLLGFPYGREFLYDEMLIVSQGEGAKPSEEALAAARPKNAEGLKPGEGPSRESCLNGSFETLYYGQGRTGELLKLVVRGDRDPGYGATSRMLAETGLLMLESPERPRGGIWLPGAAFGEALVDRLTARAGMRFDLEP